MQRIRILTPLLIVMIPIALFAREAIDLSGAWEVHLDSTNKMLTDRSSGAKTNGMIDLPGSLAENGFGVETTGSRFGILTPAYEYVGKAWYKREIDVPEEWANKRIEIFLERVLWESRVYLDGMELSRQDALGTPHIHTIRPVKPGKHELVILVDNEMIHNIGDKGHAYGSYTQSIWNGIVGSMYMQAIDHVSFVDTRIFADIEHDELLLDFRLASIKAVTCELTYEIFSVAEGKKMLSGVLSQSLRSGENAFKQTISTQRKLELWSEFNPEVYTLKLALTAGDSQDFQEIEFGFCDISHDGTKIQVNGSPVFLRGNLDCVHFPLTGYVSCQLEDWLKIFSIYKEYGFNHARFHSWCPPEAAFKAANRLGIYLQAEASIWIDWWMSTNMIERGRPEMDTKGYPKGLGHDPLRDQFVVAEMNRVVDYYGNHPSFTMFCIGNELGNSDFDVMKRWVADLKERDPRRLYAVSTARTITDVDDYSATHYIDGVGRTRGLNGPHTNWNFEEQYAQMDIPIIAHEIGQWPVYPRWSEMSKYTGVLKARNLEEFQHQAEANGIASQSDAFADASGALNQILYKYEIESLMRTPSCAGIQLLSMQDYQGQGEALIGWLDAHWESKGSTTPEKFRMHYNTTVPLLLMDKYVWESHEELTAKMQLSHHGSSTLTGEISWMISDEDGEVYAQGLVDMQSFAVGSLSDLGEVRYDLGRFHKATKLLITIKVEGTPFRNQWPVWVYPGKEASVTDDDVIVADELDAETMEQLKSGAKVLLQAHQLGTDETAVKALFYPLYWSLTFFPGQGKTCIGLLLNEQHPIFNDFPTSFHSDWQWESISADARGFILNELPHGYRPIAQPIDDFHRNNKVGSIFELKVGNGRLLVCGYNLEAETPVARQLNSSILAYMRSAAFDPQQVADERWLMKTLDKVPEVAKTKLPAELSSAILIVDAARHLQVEQTSTPWNAALDNIQVAKDVTYNLKSGTCWKEGTQATWAGPDLEIQINCPEGFMGTLLVNFNDYNRQGRSGMLDFEGRKSRIGPQAGDETWVRFHVMREDSNDGKLILRAKTETGGNLMVNGIVLLSE